MAISILAALRKHRQGAALAGGDASRDHPLYAGAVLAHPADGQVQLRGGSDRSQPGGLVPSALYPCKPGGPNDYVYVFTSRANPEHWTRLLKAIGREDLVAPRGSSSRKGLSAPRPPGSTGRR
jgi:crotonobetainyl-CoA:carnitine CoA-transferase CaiB-like acyl-CoA transferase